MSDQLALTGERTVPGIARENYWFRRHLVVYEELAPRCRGVVLEAGCGEGYGADLLAGGATRVLALDYDTQAIVHVGRRYPRVAAARANLVALPVRDSVVDTVVSLQVVEHLWDQGLFLRECRRVLAPGGALLLSTPNRITFSPGRDTPLNPFHTRELSAAELAELLVGAGFVDVVVLGLHHGPRLRALDAAHDGSLIAAQTAAVLAEAAGAAAAWPSALLRDVASVTTADFVLLPDDAGHHLDASLDLVAMARTRPSPRPEHDDDSRAEVVTRRARDDDSPYRNDDSPSRKRRLAVPETTTRRTGNDDSGGAVACRR